MADQFDAISFANNVLEGRITKVNPDGSFKFSQYDPNEQKEVEKDFDLPGFLKSQGLDPKMEVQYSTPTNPLGESAIGLATGIELSLARTTKDKLGVLENEFGKENVNLSDNGISIKQDGQWKKADVGFMGQILSESPTIAAGIAGSIKGAALGAASPIPGGALIGGIFGGAMSSAVAKWGTISAAEAMGIRTEDDAATVASEVGKEFANAAIWGAGGSLLGKGLKLAKGVTGGVMSPVKRLWDTVVDKEAIAATATKLNPGTNLVDWRTVVRSAEDTQAVKSIMDDVISHNQALTRTPVGGIDPITKKAVQSIDPATLETTKIIEQSMDGFKKTAMKNFDSAMDTLSPAFKDTRLNVTQEYADLQRSLAQMGLVDNAGEFLSKSDSSQAELIERFFDSKSRRTLKDTYEMMRKATQNNRSLSFEETRQVRRNLDNILESSGYYNGEGQIINDARNIIKQVRGGIGDKLSKSLDDKFVSVNGNKVRAAAIYNEANHKYSQFRSAYDDFAIKLGGDSQQTVSTVNRMLGESGYGLEETFGRMAEAVGGNGPALLKRLQQLRTGRNLSPLYSPAQTGISSVAKGILFGGPRQQAEFVGNTLRPLSERVRPVSAKTLVDLKARGQFVDWLQKMSPDERIKNVLTNPQLFRGAVNLMNQAPDQFDQAQQSLMGQ